MRMAFDQLVASSDVLTVVIFGGGIFLVLMLALFGFGLFDGQSQRMRRRIDQIVDPKAVASQDVTKQIESVRRNRSDSAIASVDRLMKMRLPNIDLMRQRLERSGWPLKIGDYLLICVALWMAVTGLVWISFNFSILINMLAGFTVGFGLPYLLLQRRIAKRTKKFAALLPEALDLIVRGVRSGLPVSEAIKVIAEEIEDPVGTEFQRISDQMKIGISMDDAMWETAKRLQIPEFNFLVISMSIQQETGGNLAEILEKLSNMVRRREQMRLKVKAMSSEARASAMIIGSLPFVMGTVISVINPRYMSTLFTDPRGWVMIGMGLASLIIGLGIMAKMVRFEI